MHWLARTSLANRSLVALVTVLVAVLGVGALTSLKQELIPSLQIPVVAVVAVYPGASSDVVEDRVTEPIEQAAVGVSGVSAVTSTSSVNLSVTTIELDYGTDVDRAAQRVSTQVEQLRSFLPDGVTPQVLTGSVDDLPVIQLAVAPIEGSGVSAATLADRVATILAPALEDIDDVRSVAVSGTAEQEIAISADPAVLAVAGVSAATLTSVLDDYGILLPAGTITAQDQTFSVQAGSQVTSVDEVRALPILTGTGEIVALGDLADVELADAEAASASRLNGEVALAVAITKTPDGNTVEISDAVNAVVGELEEVLANDGITVAVVFDQAPFIAESIEGLAVEGLLGLLFAVVVILLFLRSGRPTLVAALSIPLSLLATFIVMNVVGYSLNILTLGAITISIGRVVDDSIVVIENIQRHLSYGEERRAAIVGAVREVAGAITSSTVCTVVVFLPIGLTTGLVGELFRPFALTVMIAMLASLVVSLTIVPVIAYWFVRAPVSSVAVEDGERGEDGERARAAAEAQERSSLWQRAYLPSLALALRRPVVTLGIAAVVFGGTVALVPRLETNFLGDAGQDTVTVTQTFAPGTSFEAQDRAALGVEEALLDLAEVGSVQSTVGSASGGLAFLATGVAPTATFAVTMADGVAGATGQAAVRAAVESLPAAERQDALTVTGAEAAFGSSTVDLVVRATDVEDLGVAAAAVQRAAAGVEGVSDVTNTFVDAVETVQVTPDRVAVAAAGVSETAVAGMIAALMSPAGIGEVDLGDGPIAVRLAVGEAPATEAELAALPIPTASGVVPLEQVASIERVTTPTQITRVDGVRAATVSVTPASQDLGSVAGDLTAVVAELDLPVGASVEVGGVAADQEDAFADLTLALLVAIAIVYVVMVATFNSLAQPLILLISVPFAATGALLALLLTGTPLGVPAFIGLLMLVGIVVSNAIVLIDLINQYRARGRSLDDAVTEGARKRLRPIVMTAAATIFALVPMALGLTGGGAFIAQPLALVVIGGLLSSTLLTLIVVPVLYTLLEGRTERRSARRARRVAEETAAGDDADPADGARADGVEGAEAVSEETAIP